MFVSRRGHDPPRGRRLVLRVRRAAGRSEAPRPAGDRRRLGGARGELRGEGGGRTDGDERRRRHADAVPTSIVVQPRMRAYSEASKAMFAVFDDASPLVEPLSIDEAFLDVRGMRRLAGSPAEIAARLRRDVRERVGLPITVGVARTKFLAKVASGVAKPDGLLVVEPDRELDFLHPLAVERLWGVGPATARKLHAVRLLDGRRRRRAQRGDARRSARPRARAGSSTRCRGTTTRGGCGPGAAAARSGRSARSAARRPRPRRSTPRSWRSSTASRAGCGPPGGSGEPSSCGSASATSRGRRAVTRCRARRRRRSRFSRRRGRSSRRRSRRSRREGLTLVGISVANLETDDAVQLVLPFADDGQDAVDSAVDAVRNRFGTAAITRGVLVGRDARLRDAAPAGLSHVLAGRMPTTGDDRFDADGRVHEERTRLCGSR